MSERVQPLMATGDGHLLNAHDPSQRVRGAQPPGLGNGNTGSNPVRGTKEITRTRSVQDETPGQMATTNTILDKCNAVNQTLVDSYLGWMVHVRGRQPETVRVYRSLLGAYLGYCGATDVTDITVRQMETFIARPANSGADRAPASRRRDSAILRAFYQWLWESDVTLTHQASALKGPQVHNENPRPIPDDHWNMLFRVLRPHDMDPIDVHRNRVLLGLGFYCGLRRKELVELRVDNWDNGKLVNFHRKGGGEHTLDVEAILDVLNARLPQITQNIARLWQSIEVVTSVTESNQPLLGRTSVHSVNRMMSKLTAVHGLPSYTPHQLRHSAVTNLLRARVPLHLVTQMMNHSSPEITMRYIRAGGEQLREWLDDTSSPDQQQKVSEWRRSNGPSG